MNPLELRQRCHTFLSGEAPVSAAADFAAMARWCEANDIAHDVYGEGPLVEGFERKIAELLGFEKAVFCITGTMAQVVALRLACEAAGSDAVALHPRGCYELKQGARSPGNRSNARRGDAS
ncbi:MAG TPA: beta-eliminating lyase-related protein [Paucimonas sp.]|nr:beta-eliminating lyase-related protein [Paucimonas sp.]